MEVKAVKFIEMVSRLSGVSHDVILNNIVTGYLNNGGMIADLITHDDSNVEPVKPEESVEPVESDESDESEESEESEESDESEESEESDTPVSEDLPKDDSQGELFTGKDGTERRRGFTVPVERRTDHKGIVYPSQRAMCNEYGILVECYRYRREKMGWPLEKALTTPVDIVHLYETVVDHTGKQFPSFSRMCANYGLQQRTVSNRLTMGWGLEKALTTPVKQTKRRKIAKEHTDHTGKSYKSQREMCAAWHINSEIYRLRRNAGWSICRSLTAPVLTHQSDADLLNCKEG